MCMCDGIENKNAKVGKENNSIGIFSNFVSLEIIYRKKKKKMMEYQNAKIGII